MKRQRLTHRKLHSKYHELSQAAAHFERTMQFAKAHALWIDASMHATNENNYWWASNRAASCQVNLNKIYRTHGHAYLRTSQQASVAQTKSDLIVGAMRHNGEFSSR